MQDLKNWKPCPPPQGVTLKGRFVTVEGYDREKHLQALWDAFGGLHVNTLMLYFTQNDFKGIEDFDTWLTSCQTKGGWVTEVFRDNGTGRVVGMANYMRADPANGVVEVGGVCHGPAMARTPLATEAHYLMAKHAFEDLGYRRYEWKCHNDNKPSHAAARRYGFTFEGVFRQHMVSKNGNRDSAWYSIIDKEWPVVGKAFETWLSPENFNADGSQKRGLEAIRADIAAETGA